MVELVNATTRRDPNVVATGRMQPRPPESPELDLLRLTLNQVDYGLVVVNVASRAVQYANALGHDALEGVADHFGNKPYDTGLQRLQGCVAARRPADAEQLRHTLERTRAGVRGLLSLGIGSQTCAVAVVPLGAPVDRCEPTFADYGSMPDAPACHALLVFAKQQLCDSSTVALFARERGLTSAEGQVLAQVCRGLRPSEIADHHGVQISTVRTQLRNIRQKTCCDTIGEVIQKVSVLPPMARHLSGHAPSIAWQ
jgi:DNA-binding CsgD family transcriptional regulator